MLSPQRENFLRDNIYIKHYKSGYAVFKNHPLFGVGNKNYRIETRKINIQKKTIYQIHIPHQIYFELLSEHGIIGTIIFLSIIFFLIFSKLKNLYSFKKFSTTWSILLPSDNKFFAIITKWFIFSVI